MKNMNGIFGETGGASEKQIAYVNALIERGDAGRNAGLKFGVESGSNYAGTSAFEKHVGEKITNAIMTSLDVTKMTGAGASKFIDTVKNYGLLVAFATANGVETIDGGSYKNETQAIEAAKFLTDISGDEVRVYAKTNKLGITLWKLFVGEPSVYCMEEWNKRII